MSQTASLTSHILIFAASNVNNGNNIGGVAARFNYPHHPWPNIYLPSEGVRTIWPRCQNKPRALGITGTKGAASSLLTARPRPATSCVPRPRVLSWPGPRRPRSSGHQRRQLVTIRLLGITIATTRLSPGSRCHHGSEDCEAAGAVPPRGRARPR